MVTPFNPTTLASQVYGIAGAGISLGLLAGMSRGISDMTWKEPNRRSKQAHRYRKYRGPVYKRNNPYKTKYTWRY